jgi:hypothetical protein
LTAMLSSAADVSLTLVAKRKPRASRCDWA